MWFAPSPYILLVDIVFLKEVFALSLHLSLSKQATRTTSLSSMELRPFTRVAATRKEIVFSQTSDAQFLMCTTDSC